MTAPDSDPMPSARWCGLRYLPPPLALSAALSLEGMMYLTNDPAEWSNNVALAVGWAWTIVLGERAVRTNGIGSWLAVGAVIGLTLLCKYTLGVLLLPLAVYLVWNAKQLGDTLPPEVAKRFPTAIREPALELQYCTGADIPPARIGLALVPPGR